MGKIIDKIMADAKARGYEVRLRDVGFAILCVSLEDDALAYRLIFGDDPNLKTFVTLDRIKYLIKYFKDEKAKSDADDSAKEIAELIAKSKGKKKNADESSMSFEENREGIEQQLREIVELKKEAMEQKGDADLKTLALLQKTEADLRVKLNDKFGASEKSAEQYIIVQPKYNKICPHTRHECWEMTKEYAMQAFNLVEKEDNDG